MTGRELFARIEPILNLLASVLKLLPRSFARFLYWLTSAVPGPIGRGIRYPLVKRLAKECGKTVAIAERVVILEWHNLSIGSNVQIHPFCYLDASGGISIGDNVSIAHGSSILSFEHTWSDLRTPIKYNPRKLLSVEIQDDVWVGCGVRILAGAILHTRTIIAAGAVVLAGEHKRGIHAGVPAKLLKSI